MADTEKFFVDLKSDNAAARFAAWRRAGEVGPSAIADIGKIAASADPGVAKAGREALRTLVHSVGKEPGSANRAGVVKGLLELAAQRNPMPVRVHALRLLSHIAGADSVPMIAKWLREPAVREEAIFAIERVPGDAPDKALLAAYQDAPDELKPRVLAALGHRRVAAAAPLCAEAMRSPNSAIAVAAAKAFGRIGQKTDAPIRRPDSKGMTAWDRMDVDDAMLRYAEALSKSGDAAEAIRVYRTYLDRPEEHLQCAAVIGLAKAGTPEAAALIHSKLGSDDTKVRNAAIHAWKQMASPKSRI